jgi:hypothetical protein
MKHQKIITDKIIQDEIKNEIGIVNIINEAYFFHKIDQYAKHFGAEEIDKVLEK